MAINGVTTRMAKGMANGVAVNVTTGVKGVISVTSDELNLHSTLTSGQSFRWRPVMTGKGDDRWVGVIDNQFVVELWRTDDNHIRYHVLNPHEDKHNDHFLSQMISNYLRLDVQLSPLYAKWRSIDPHFPAVGQSTGGLRVLRQNLTETVFAFICSANNHIKRIETMVDTLCRQYGHVLYDSHPQLATIYSFPDIQCLATDNVRPELKRLGFGYRSAYIERTAKSICREYKSPQEWANCLSEMSYEESRRALIRLPGVGPKVADCIALMALGHMEAVPVDTHVFKVAQRSYLPHLCRNKTLTHKTYQEIGNFFRQKFGREAGWAQAVLFANQLKQSKTI